MDDAKSGASYEERKNTLSLSLLMITRPTEPVLI